MTKVLHLLVTVTLFLQWNVRFISAFQTTIATRCQTVQRQLCGNNSASASVRLGATGDGNAASEEAERLLAKAKAIRESLGTESNDDVTKSDATKTGQQQKEILSDFSLPSSLANGFRLYLDIGRETGTWMDPRWGASGRRIECTVDVSFDKLVDEDTKGTLLASEDIVAGLIKTVTSKSSSLSEVCKLRSAPYARLRGGFDKMAISDGGYCIESSSSASLSSSSTLRLCLSVAGATNGDVSIPEGKLYFALPYFGLQTSGGNGDSTAATMALSNKEGTVTVKQMGWHTGWYREESRILGVFRATPLEKARARDKF